MNEMIQTEKEIKFVKDTFEKVIAEELNLTRVSAPLFLEPTTGLNDHLNGYERAVRFDVLDLKKDVEIVQSLAKWKRYALKRYCFETHTGLYTDMNAIRRDEELDYLHSIYVDQWDWEKIINKEDRNLDYLFETVKKIYKALVKTEKIINQQFPKYKNKLVDNITFISTEELLQAYPDKTPKEREYEITKKHHSVFIYQIGKKLSNNEIHDGRAADYDDWSLNGDIIVFDEAIDTALELSSMGIRVDENSIVTQLKAKNEEDKLTNPYVLQVINKELPYTIGGGIGQSRICMFYLEKHHIGEVQVSLWSDEVYKQNKHIL